MKSVIIRPVVCCIRFSFTGSRKIKLNYHVPQKTSSYLFFLNNSVRYQPILTIFGRSVVFESGLDSSPDLSPFLLDLYLDSDLGRFVTKSTLNFHCAHLQCFV